MKETSKSRSYSVSEAARELDVSPSTVWRWIEAHKLPAYRVGPKRIRIRKEDLEGIVRPARPEGEEVKLKESAALEPPTPEELTRRQALVARILAKRQERLIAPETTTDLVKKARDKERKSYASR